MRSRSLHDADVMDDASARLSMTPLDGGINEPGTDAPTEAYDDVNRRIEAAMKEVEQRHHAAAAAILAAVDLPRSAPLELQISFAEALARARERAIKHCCLILNHMV